MRAAQIELDLLDVFSYVSESKRHKSVALPIFSNYGDRAFSSGRTVDVKGTGHKDCGMDATPNVYGSQSRERFWGIRRAVLHDVGCWTLIPGSVVGRELEVRNEPKPRSA